MHSITDGINSFINHPMFTSEPKKILKFSGNNLRGPQKRTRAKIDKGKRFEEEVAKTLEDAFPDAVVLRDMYFLTGNYYENIMLYGSVQIDIIVISSKCVYVVECKSFSEDVRSLYVSSGTDKWRLYMKSGRRKNELNGATQNRWHENYMFEYFYFRGIRVPLKRITVIGGLTSDQITVGLGCERDNIIVFDDLVETIYALEMDLHETIDSLKLENELISVEWKNKERGLLHFVYVRKNKGGLPPSCKGNTVEFH